jgi:hypothetical protein
MMLLVAAVAAAMAALSCLAAAAALALASSLEVGQQVAHPQACAPVNSK